jgi:hypothetical protein
MNNTYRYIQIYVDLLYRDFPMDNTYRYHHLKPRVSQHILNLVYNAYYAAVPTRYSSRSRVVPRARASIMLVLVCELKRVLASIIEI